MPIYKSNFKKVKKITYILKLRIILRTKTYIFSFNKKYAKCIEDPRDRKHFKTCLHTDTGYPVQTPNL